MTVPFLDLRAPYAELGPAIDAAIARVMASGWYILGEEVRAFEEEFAAYCGAAHCVGLSNGLDALHLVLRAWDIRPGDEVIVPAHTFIATWLAVAATGATPVAADVDPRTFNLDPSAVERAVTGRTRAVIPVHLYGQPADLDPILAIAARHGFRVLEDAAQAHGARYHRRRAGALGHAAAFSFYPSKNLGAVGDGGAVTTDDPRTAERVRLLANYGSPRKYEHVARGMNCRLDEVQAAVLRVKLGCLDEWNRRRSTVAAAYTAALAGSSLVAPEVPPDMEPVWHLYVVRAADRTSVQHRLAAFGIQTLIHYPSPPYLQPAFAGHAPLAPAMPVATALADDVLSLPIGPHMTPDQVATVAAALRDA